jgi:hypothetical protein
MSYEWSTGTYRYEEQNDAKSCKRPMNVATSTILTVTSSSERRDTFVYEPTGETFLFVAQMLRIDFTATDVRI